MAETSPARAIAAARSTDAPTNRPASAAGMSRFGARSRTTRSAPGGGSAITFSTISGPIPRGSPSVMAMRGRTVLETDVDVGAFLQLLQVLVHRVALAEVRLDLVPHFLVGGIAFG